MSGFNNIPSNLPPIDPSRIPDKATKTGELSLPNGEILSVTDNPSKDLLAVATVVEEAKDIVLSSDNVSFDDLISDALVEKKVTLESDNVSFDEFLNSEPVNAQSNIAILPLVNSSMDEALGKVNFEKPMRFIPVSSKNSAKEEALYNDNNLFIPSNLSRSTIAMLQETLNPHNIFLLDAHEFNLLKQTILIRLEQKKKDSKKQESTDHKTLHKPEQKTIIYESDEQENIDEEAVKNKTDKNFANKLSRKNQIEKINAELLMNSQLKRKERRKEEEKLLQQKQGVNESELKQEIKKSDDTKQIKKKRSN